MRKSNVATAVAGMTVRLVDGFISLDSTDPAERFARAAPASSRFWFMNPLAWLALLLIAGYRILIPVRRKRACRFSPSCSNYMSASIRKYGLWQGGIRGLHRLRRCTGFVPAGEDIP